MTPRVIFMLLALMGVVLLAFVPIETWLSWSTLGAAMVGWSCTGKRWRYDTAILAGGLVIIAADWGARFALPALGA